MISTSFTGPELLAAAIPWASMSDGAKEVATPDETDYKSVSSRDFRSPAWPLGELPAHIRNLLTRVLAWKTQRMAAQENAETVETPCIPDHYLVRRIGK